MPVKFNSDKFYAARKAKNVTQEQLAELAGSSARYIGALERGENDNPSAALVYQLSEALDVSMESLMETSKEIGGDSIS